MLLRREEFLGQTKLDVLGTVFGIGVKLVEGVVEQLGQVDWIVRVDDRLLVVDADDKV